MKKATVLGFFIIAVFGVIALYALRGAMVPYVKFIEARSSEKTVQIAGIIVPDSQVREKDGTFLFKVEDPEGDQMLIAYRGTKPGNFDQATSIVSLGRFKEGKFHASRLLVKCPSKYEDRLHDPAEAEKFYQNESVGK